MVALFIHKPYHAKIIWKHELKIRTNVCKHSVCSDVWLSALLSSCTCPMLRKYSEWPSSYFLPSSFTSLLLFIIFVAITFSIYFEEYHIFILSNKPRGESNKSASFRYYAAHFVSTSFCEVGKLSNFFFLTTRSYQTLVAESGINPFSKKKKLLQGRISELDADHYLSLRAVFHLAYRGQAITSSNSWSHQFQLIQKTEKVHSTALI
jgi:hypothetical protein